MIALTLRSEAEKNLSEASQWYEAQRKGLGVDFVEAVEKTLHKIRRSPLRYPKIYKQVRRAQTRRFPYGVFYLVEGDRIVVLRVLHQSRSPTRWQRTD